MAPRAPRFAPWLHGVVVAVGALASIATSQRRPGWSMQVPDSEKLHTVLTQDGEQRTTIVLDIGAATLNRQHPPNRAALALRGQAYWHARIDSEPGVLTVWMPNTTNDGKAPRYREIVMPKQMRELGTQFELPIADCPVDRRCRRTYEIAFEWAHGGDAPLEIDWTIGAGLTADGGPTHEPPKGATATLEVVK